MRKHDPALDALLDLDGLTFVVDPEGGHWVRFVVNQVPATPEKPHGLDYSLTLHGRNGERLVGFDNAHQVAGKSVVGHRIIAIGFGWCALMSTAMQGRCLPISGRKWTRC